MEKDEGLYFTSFHLVSIVPSPLGSSPTVG